MFENYSYKKKFIGLLLLFLILLVTAYKRSFNTLFQVINENKELSLKAADYVKKSNNSNRIIKEIAYLDNTIGKQGETKEKIQQGIVSFALKNNKEISINDLQPIHLFSDEKYTVITNQLDVTGNTNKLLELSYDYEKEFNDSRIISMNFYTSKKNDQVDILHLKLTFQNYEDTK